MAFSPSKPVKTLAFPATTDIALTTPLSDIACLECRTDGADAVEIVKTPATLDGFSNKNSVTSSRFLYRTLAEIDAILTPRIVGKLIIFFGAKGDTDNDMIDFSSQ